MMHDLHRKSARIYRREVFNRKFCSSLKYIYIYLLENKQVSLQMKILERADKIGLAPKISIFGKHLHNEHGRDQKTSVAFVVLILLVFVA